MPRLNVIYFLMILIPGFLQAFHAISTMLKSAEKLKQYEIPHEMSKTEFSFHYISHVRPGENYVSILSIIMIIIVMFIGAALYLWSLAWLSKRLGM